MSVEEAEEKTGGYRPPPSQLGTWVVLGAAFLGVLSLFSVRTSQNPNSSRDYPSYVLPPDQPAVLLEEPEMDEEYWPCSDCHEGEPTNYSVRVLEEDHENREDFYHGDRWCLDCHDADDRDSLHLADGTLVSFDETWKLCVQCHGGKLDDWRAGVHGKRTGHWWGEKDYRSCVACHNPHKVDPAFEPIEGEPRPRCPEELTIDGNLWDKELCRSIDKGHNSHGAQDPEHAEREDAHGQEE